MKFSILLIFSMLVVGASVADPTDAEALQLPLETSAPKIPEPAVAPQPEVVESPPELPAAEANAEILPPPSDPSPQSMRLTLIGAIDVTYSLGGAIHQGFLLPSSRLGLDGNLSNIDFRIQAGQVREISSSYIEELRPLDAWVGLPVKSTSEENGFQLKLKVGLFYPDYDGVFGDEKSQMSSPWLPLFIGESLPIRDLGAQLKLKWQFIRADLGIFNGHQIHSINSNHSRAFLGRIGIESQMWVGKIVCGLSFYSQVQGDVTSSNYREFSWTGAYIDWTTRTLPLRFIATAQIGTYQDLSNYLNPEGFLVELRYREKEKFGFFARWETARNIIGYSNSMMYQVGPSYLLSSHITLLSYYQVYQNALGNEGSAQFLLRAAF